MSRGIGTEAEQNTVTAQPCRCTDVPENETQSIGTKCLCVREREREIITLTADRAKRICLPESSLQWQRPKLWMTSSQRQTTESPISFLLTLVRRRAHDRLWLVRKHRRNCPWSQPRLLARTLESPPLPLQTLSRAGSRQARSARCKQQRWLKREVFPLRIADWQRATKRGDFFREEMWRCGSWGLCTYLACWCKEEHISGRDWAFQLLTNDRQQLLDRIANRKPRRIHV